MKFSWAMVLALVLLAGCATRPAPVSDGTAATAYAARFSDISAWQRWNLTARLGVDDGTEGGSGRLDWQVNGVQETLRFRGALGQGAWRIDIDADSARLQRADGSVTTAPQVQELVLRELGWQAPVDALGWWVRGLAQADGASPGHRHDLDLADDGTPIQLQQQGWTVEYTRYKAIDEMLLPTRLEARKGPYTLKLAISRWDFSAPDHE